MLKISLAIVFPLLSCAAGFADSTIRLSNDNGASFSNNFTAVSGDTLNFSIYLFDSEAGGDLASNGLGSFILSGAMSPTSFGSITSTEVSDQYEFVFGNNSTASTIFWDAATFDTPVPRGDSILLGTFSFQSTGAGSTTFDFFDDDPNSDDWFSGTVAGQQDPNVLDELIFGPNAGTKNRTIITTVAIPEPGSAAATFLLACAVVARRKRS